MKVVLDRERCCGNKACLKSPFYFKLENGKVAFQEGSFDKTEAEADFTDFGRAKLLEAAKACPVNAITVLEGGKELVGSSVKTAGMRIVAAEYDDEKEFVLDPKGYFLIRALPERQTVEVGFCKEKNEVSVKIYGRGVREIYHTAIREGLVSRLDHAAYLGREVQKAFDSMWAGILYVQDAEFVMLENSPLWNSRPTTVELKERLRKPI